MSALALGGTAGTFGLTLAVVFALAFACAWLLPVDKRPLHVVPAVAIATTLAVAFGVGASYWRASPVLEHSQPAFACALAGLLRPRTILARRAQHVALGNLGEAGKRPNVVLVLGESLAASHLTVYGYERDTSPRLGLLADAGRMVVMRDASVMGPNTRASLPYILTGLEGPDAEGRVIAAPTVLDYARARGYHTAFISAQEESWGSFDVLFRAGTDVFRSGIAFAPAVDVMDGADDLDVLEQGALPVLRTLPEPFFVVLHMNGGHAPYGHHSRRSCKVFLPEDGVNSVNAYDNTVRETDEYVARVFEALRARDPEAWMFFTSDHGQPLGEGGAFFNHGSQSNVVRDPLLAFPPDAMVARFAELADSPLAACDLAPTMLHVMGAPRVRPMDCVDWLAEGDFPRARVRVVSAYTPVAVGEPTMMLLMPGGGRELFDLARGTVVSDDAVRPLTEVSLPPQVAARLHP